MSVHRVPGVDLETVEIRLRLSQTALDRLTTGSVVPVKAVWLTLQLDGTYALGFQSDVPPGDLGLQSRRVDVDERGDERIVGPA